MYVRRETSGKTVQVHIIVFTAGQCDKYHNLEMSREGSGSVVECLTQDQKGRSFEPHRRHIYPRFVLVQPRKTCPYITERLLMGRKESNKTNKLKC